MISRRSKRPAAPQESPRQFAVNNSKGLDFTKAATEPSTSQFFENLTVNLDGSLSIRRRMFPVYLSKVPSDDVLLTVLHTGAHVLVKSSTEIYVAKRNANESCKAETSYVTSRSYFYPDTAVTLSGASALSVPDIDMSEATFQTTSDSTLIGNVKVSKKYLQSENWKSEDTHFTVLDSGLHGTDGYVLRYLRITLDAKGEFELHILQPEPTTISGAESEIALNPNLTLDNPYAIRDVYSVKGAASVLGILPYLVPKDSVSVRVFESENEDSYKKLTCTPDPSTRIADITEPAKFSDSTFQLVNAISSSLPVEHYALKAFCKIPDTATFECFWEYTFDGDTWHGVVHFPNKADLNLRLLPNPNYAPDMFEDGASGGGSDGDDTLEIVGKPYSKYLLVLTAPFTGTSSEDLLIRRTSHGSGDDLKYRYSGREDVLIFGATESSHRVTDTATGAFALERPYAVRFSIVSASSTLVTVSLDGVSAAIHPVTVLDSQTYVLDAASSSETLKTDLPNAVAGEKLYYKKSIYSYGTSEFLNMVYRSDTGSAITPMYNVLDLDATPGIVCAVIPWRDYLMSFTESAIYLSHLQDSGYYTKVLSTSVGVPFSDRHSVQPTLNGVVFKSGTKIYMAYPNIYSGDDTHISLTEVSKPIAHILEELPDDGLVESHISSDVYSLLVSVQSTQTTHCLQFDFSKKTWEYHTYPLAFSKFFKDIFGDLTGVYDNVEYSLFETPAYGKHSGILLDDIRYSDGAPASFQYTDVVYDVRSNVFKPAPIHFELDTGQKTDNIVSMKHFVESRMIFMTEDESEDFPVDLTITVDGDPHVTTVSTTTDLSTDAAFWKIEDSVGVVGTAFRLTTDPEDTLFGRSKSGMFRQLAVRYSGKGRSIRHILTGESKSNFRIYETYIKYKVLKS